jgi:DNA-binding NtrC family response regulator
VVLATPNEGGIQIETAIRDLGYLPKRVSRVGEVGAALAGSANVAAVVTELALLDGNWRDLVECVKAQDADLPVVLCTGVTTVELWWDALECGVAEILVPPYTFLDFEQVLKIRPAQLDG